MLLSIIFNDRTDLLFEPNVGQADPSQQFLTRASGSVVFLRDATASLDLRQPGGTSAGVIRMSLGGAKTKPAPVAEDAAPGRVNYFYGSDPDRWLSDIPTFRRIRYRDVYPGIDIVYYGNSGRLEHDFIVKPGADPYRIRMQFSGDERRRIDTDGSIVLETGGREVRWQKPVVYQRNGRELVRVEAAYRPAENGSLRFEVGVYDPKRELVIDPVITFSSFLGRNNPDIGTRLAVDSSGNTYMTGATFDTQYPVTPGAYRSPFTIAERGNVIITKINAAGNAMVYSTHIGGVETDGALGIAVDAAGSVYVAGGTDSPDFPVTDGAFQKTNRSDSTPGMSDCFVAKLNASGSALVYSTLLGGRLQDACSAVAVDGEGNAYVTGITSSSNFPVSDSALQRTYRGGSGRVIFVKEGDAFVSKISPDGSKLVYSTFLGSSGDEAGYAIAVNPAGEAFVAGSTNSTFGFPTTTGAMQTAPGGSGGQGTVQLGDAFIVKLAADGGSLRYGTLLGGNRDDVAFAIQVDAAGNAYVAGSTLSPNFPVSSNAYQRTYKGAAVFDALFVGGDGFVTKIDPTGARAVFSTYLGGANDDRILALALDPTGAILVAGNTMSTDFPISTDATQRTFGGQRDTNIHYVTGDAFLSKLTANGDALPFSTYIGGSGNDWAMGLGVDSRGAISITGGTSSLDFPATPGALQANYGGGPEQFLPTGDAFLVRMGENAASSPVSISGIVSAASYAGAGVVPGEIVVLTGVNIGPTQLRTLTLDANGRVANSLASTRVLFDGVPAPVVYASAAQTSVIVPYAVAGRGSTVVTAEFANNRSVSLTVPVLPVKPALFSANSSGRGPGAILNQDFSFNSAANPAAKGSVVQLFGTGEGQTDPPGVDGRLATQVVPRITGDVAVTIGGETADVLYAGAAPGQVAGLFQLNAKVPESLGAGNHPVVVRIRGVASQTGLTVAVR
ncbi:MAG: SBBP repeat-containing protein [Bryobacteraceae bacterium]